MTKFLHTLSAVKLLTAQPGVKLGLSLWGKKRD